VAALDREEFLRSVNLWWSTDNQAGRVAEPCSGVTWLLEVPGVPGGAAHREGRHEFEGGAPVFAEMARVRPGSANPTSLENRAPTVGSTIAAC